MKALKTYLNGTGAADYNLPQMTGKKIIESKRSNQPNWTLKSRTKLSWFPERAVDFQAQSSPPSTLYSPKPDRDFKT